MTLKENEISTKEIRGITAKTLVWLIGGFGTVIVTVMTTYFSIIQKLDRIDTIQGSVNTIEAKLENNSSDIKMIQQHTIPSLDNRMSIMEERMKDKIFIKDAP